MPELRPTLDPERLKEFAKHVFGALSGAMTSAMICLGDRLGLYRSLANEGPADSAELARRTGLAERWLREWLHQQGAAGVLEHLGDERFALTPEGRAVLADERSPAFGCGMFASLPETIAVLDRMPEAFASGVGLDYDALGPGGARRRRARLRALVPRAARADGAAAHRGRGARARARRARRRRRLRRRRRAARDGEGVSEVGVPRLRHLASRALARRGEPPRRGRQQRRLPRRAPRAAARRRELRVRHHVRLPARHDATPSARSRRSAPRCATTAPGSSPTSRRATATRPTCATTRWPRSCTAPRCSRACRRRSRSRAGSGSARSGCTRSCCARWSREAGFTRFEPLDLGHPVNAFYVVRP